MTADGAACAWCLDRQLQHKFLNRAAVENRPLLAEAVDLRDRIATLLGYDSWAENAIEVKMAQSPSAVPAELVQRLVAARDLNIGLFSLRQVFLGKLDLALHTGRPGDLDAISREAYRYTQLPFHEDRLESTAQSPAPTPSG